MASQKDIATKAKLMKLLESHALFNEFLKQTRTAEGNDESTRMLQENIRRIENEFITTAREWGPLKKRPGKKEGDR